MLVTEAATLASLSASRDWKWSSSGRALVFAMVPSTMCKLRSALRKRMLGCCISKVTSASSSSFFFIGRRYAPRPLPRENRAQRGSPTRSARPTYGRLPLKVGARHCGGRRCRRWSRWPLIKGHAGDHAFESSLPHCPLVSSAEPDGSRAIGGLGNRRSAATRHLLSCHRPQPTQVVHPAIAAAVSLQGRAAGMATGVAS